jgi:hypothetical protein
LSQLAIARRIRPFQGSQRAREFKSKIILGAVRRPNPRGFIVLLKRLASQQKLAVLLIAHPSLAGMSSGSGLSGSTD